MLRILVSGSQGFIGSNLVRKLGGSAEIFKLDAKDSLNSQNFYKLDLNSPELTDVLNEIKPNVVIHLAAQISVLDSLKDPKTDLMINGMGTLNLVQASIAAGVKNFCYVNSGGAIYAKNAQLPIAEDSSTHPQSPYGASKLLGEYYVQIFCEAAKIGWSSLALSNCFGPVREHGKGVIYQFWKAISENRVPDIFGSEVTRDFIYIDDVIAAIESAAETPTMGRVNISSGIETNLIDVFNLVKEIIKSDISPNILAPGYGEIRRSALRNSQAKQILGWEPTTSFQEGIRKALKEEMGS
jgi:UDP-glucose 4-epimerase